MPAIWNPSFLGLFLSFFGRFWPIFARFWLKNSQKSKSVCTSLQGFACHFQKGATLAFLKKNWISSFLDFFGAFFDYEKSQKSKIGKSQYCGIDIKFLKSHSNKKSVTHRQRNACHLKSFIFGPFLSFFGQKMQKFNNPNRSKFLKSDAISEKV